MTNMPEKMRRFLAKKPRVAHDRSRSRPMGWMADCLKRQGRKCYYCRARMVRNPSPAELGRKPTLDHVVPLSRGGENKRHNVVAACYDCNQAKASMTAEEFMTAQMTSRESV